MTADPWEAAEAAWVAAADAVSKTLSEALALVPACRISNVEFEMNMAARYMRFARGHIWRAKAAMTRVPVNEYPDEQTFKDLWEACDWFGMKGARHLAPAPTVFRAHGHLLVDYDAERRDPEGTARKALALIDGNGGAT